MARLLLCSGSRVQLLCQAKGKVFRPFIVPFVIKPSPSGVALLRWSYRRFISFFREGRFNSLPSLSPVELQSASSLVLLSRASVVLHGTSSCSKPFQVTWPLLKCDRRRREHCLLLRHHPLRHHPLLHCHPLLHHHLWEQQLHSSPTTTTTTPLRHRSNYKEVQLAMQSFEPKYNYTI